MKIFFTGDRSMPIELAVINMSHAIAALAGEAAILEQKLTIATGENHGIEEAVRRIAGSLQVPFDIIHNPARDADGKMDWDQRHAAVNIEYDQIFVIHSDIMSSHIGASCVRMISDEKLHLVT